MTPDYSKLTTERIDESLNFRRNHRFYLLYGKNATDEFLTRSFYRANLLQTLWATLKGNGFERVVFYNFADKFFFLDADSARVAKAVSGNQQQSVAQESVAAAGGGGAAGPGRRQVGPMGASRNVLRRETPVSAAANPVSAGQTDGNGASPPQQQYAPDENGIIRMTPKRTAGDGMADASVLTHFNDFVTDSTVKTALVIEDLENLSRIHDGVKRQLAIRLQQWNALPNRNQNAVIFINSRNPSDADSQHAMRLISTEFAEIANLVSIAFGQKKGETEGFILHIPTPFEAEVERWLNTFRLKNRLPVEWREFKKLAQWMTAENKQLKDLDGKLNEYLARRRKGNQAADEKLSLALARQNKWISGDSDPRPALERLQEMIGLQKVKEQIRNLHLQLKSQEQRRRNNPQSRIEPPNLHLVFTGNPGTGKTTVARLIGEIYRDLELLKRGHTVEVLKNDIVEGYVGQTAPKTNAKINEALDGVFFLDEAYSLKDSGEEGSNDFGRDALNTIMARMENERHRLAVILAGYEQEMESLIRMNPGMNRRIGRTINFEDYNGDELLQIFERLAANEDFTIGEQMRVTMRRLFTRMYERRNDKDFFSFDEKGKSTFGNAGEVRKLFQAMTAHQAVRLDGGAHDELTIEDLPPDYQKFLPPATSQSDLMKLLGELEDMVGLQPVKDVVRELVEEVQFVSYGGAIGSSAPTRHMVFTGNPGTGKSTVARLIGKIYRALGILQKGHFKEVTRSDLVGEYQGHSEQKTKRVIQEALDGVLLIDEAYSLARDPLDAFGKLAIDTLVPMLEDYRDRLVVIFAGYTMEMQYFINSNSGLKSRIGYEIEFPDYTPEMLLEILLRMAAKDNFIVPENVRNLLQEMFIRFYDKRGRNFGNARDVRVQFYEKMIKQWRRRFLDAVNNGQRAEDVPRVFILSDLMDHQGSLIT
ncbi:MAG: AAA family ATPase [Acidobacteriota bacterium]|nr:AAA family ATPase [Acidobacteriota bacterium]